MNLETKVGVFATLGLCLLGLAIFMLGDFSLAKEYPVFVRFSDVAGLPDKSIVKLSGVDVGKVKSIDITDEGIVVRLAIRSHVKIYRNAKFQIGSTSIIGSKYLQIDQGTPSAGALSEGEYVNGVNTLPLDRTLANTLQSVQSLLDDVGQKGRLGASINETLVNLRDLTANLNDLIVTVQPHVDKSMQNVDNLTGRLDSLVTKLDALMDKINSGQGAVGALVSDPKVKEDVKETVSNIKDASGKAKTILDKVGAFRVFWLYSSKYEPQARTSRTDVGIKISPRPGRYYQVGLANISNPLDDSTAPDYVEKNRVDARLGWENPRLDFYVGAIRGAGGFGAQYKPFYEHKILKRWSVMAEASDFMRNRTINGRHFGKPIYTVGTDIEITRVISLGARATDLLGTGNSQYVLNIKFEDKDIAYLLGLVTMGSMRNPAPK